MLIAKIPQGHKAELRFTLNPDRNVVDVRVFDRFTSTGLYTVTKTGLTISVGDIDAVVAALTEAKAATSSNGGGDA